MVRKLFSRQTFQDVVDRVASELTDITSGVIQRSVLSPVSVSISLDPLLQAASELIGPDSYVFADDFKIVTGSSPREHH